MIGLDTNVVVRYITQDDPDQSNLAGDFIEKYCTRSNPGFVNLIVCCEIVWVLKRAYGYDKTTILAVMKQILQTAELHIENADLVWKALSEFESGNADFSDYLISSINRNNDCSYTVTFDKKAASLSQNKLL